MTFWMTYEDYDSSMYVRVRSNQNRHTSCTSAILHVLIVLNFFCEVIRSSYHLFVADAWKDPDVLGIYSRYEMAASAEGARNAGLDAELAERADVVDQQVQQAEFVEETWIQFAAVVIVSKKLTILCLKCLVKSLNKNI